MVCLKDSEADMVGWIYMEDLKASEFRDDDLGNMLTAVAVGPLSREDGGRLFGDLSLA